MGLYERAESRVVTHEEMLDLLDTLIDAGAYSGEDDLRNWADTLCAWTGVTPPDNEPEEL